MDHLVDAATFFLFWLISTCRQFLFRKGIFASYRAPVPVIVVGNLSVGETVKPLSLFGWSNSYNKRSQGWCDFSWLRKPIICVSFTCDARHGSYSGGDEPVLIAKRTQVPVCISANRQHAIELLLQHRPDCDLIISDDGLQHYRLQRDFEIVVLDVQRGFGNGFYYLLDHYVSYQAV